MKSPFILTVPDQRPLEELHGITTLLVPLRGHTAAPGIKKRVAVAANTLLAVHPDMSLGEIHAPCDGVIKDITARHIEITCSEAPPEGTQPVAPVTLSGLDEQALCTALKELGISVRPFTRPCKTFVINGLNPEPGMVYAEELLCNHKEILEAALALVKRLSPATDYVLALPAGSKCSLTGMRNHFVKPEYPISLARPLIKSITGKESSADITMVRLHDLFGLGLVASSGLPRTRTVISVQGRNFLVPMGTPVQTLLDAALVKVQPGDTVVLGGAMRGQALSVMRRGIDKDSEALLHIPAKSKPPLEDNPCINCGACIYACPMRLRPNMLSRYAEFEQYEGCAKEYINRCIECGLCGYVCPSCRPMQQYFRNAKKALGIETLQRRLPL